jgi:DNA polymerase V
MIALVDCNNFFASCERLFRPDLKNRPVMVLSNNDGCVVARSQEVKDLGVPMAVPYFKVRDIVLNNNVVCFSSNFPLYSNISQRILNVLSDVTPQLEVYSIDEAFLDLKSLKVGDYQTFGDELTSKIKAEVGMPVSVGIGPTKTLAKLAEGHAKKQQRSLVLDPAADFEAYQKVLEATPVGDIWGIGWRLTPRFKAAGVKNAWQLLQASPSWLKNQLGITGGRMQAELKGQMVYGFSEHKSPQKSLLVSRSFGHAVTAISELETAVATFASSAAYQLRRHEQAVREFGIFLRYKTPDDEHKNISLKAKLINPTNDTSELVLTALRLLGQVYDPLMGYKKAGVFAGSLQSTNICQVDLFDVLSPTEKQKRRRLMQALDNITNRYGSYSIHVGSIDPKNTQWHALKKRMSPAYTTDWAQLPKVYPL